MFISGTETFCLNSKLPISNMAIVDIPLAMVINTLSQSYRSAFGIKARVAVNKLADLGVNGVVVWPWAQNRKIKSSSIAGALLIPHTC